MPPAVSDAPLEIYGDLRDVDPDDATELESPAPNDYTRADDMAAKMRPDLLSGNAELGAAFGVSPHWIEKHVARSIRHHPDGRHEAGYRVDAFLAAAKRENIPCPVSEPIAAALTDTLPHEAIPDGSFWSVQRASGELGIPEEVIVTALRRGPTTWNSDRNPAEWLRRLVEEQGINLRPDLATAMKVARGRARATDATDVASEVADAQPGGLSEAVFDKIEQWETADADAIAQNSLSASAKYRELLARDGSPEPGDAEVLAMVVEVLKLDRVTVARDLQLLAQAAELERLAADRDDAMAELTAANEEWAGIAKRQKDELDAARKRKSRAWERNNLASRAPHELAALKQSRPEVFGDA